MQPCDLDSAVSDSEGTRTAVHDVHFAFECDTEHDHRDASPRVGGDVPAVRRVGRGRVVPAVARAIRKHDATPLAANLVVQTVSAQLGMLALDCWPSLTKCLCPTLADGADGEERGCPCCGGQGHARGWHVCFERQDKEAEDAVQVFAKLS